MRIQNLKELIQNLDPKKSYEWSESGGSIYIENQLKNGPPLSDQNFGQIQKFGQIASSAPPNGKCPVRPWLEILKCDD